MKCWKNIKVQRDKPGKLGAEQRDETRDIRPVRQHGSAASRAVRRGELQSLLARQQQVVQVPHGLLLLHHRLLLLSMLLLLLQLVLRQVQAKGSRSLRLREHWRNFTTYFIILIISSILHSSTTFIAYFHFDLYLSFLLLYLYTRLCCYCLLFKHSTLLFSQIFYFCIFKSL